MQDLEALLVKHWGHPKFRPPQKEIIQSVLDGRDTLALMPTGGGKSVCFQISALAQEGICIVISPLIALMKDQVEQLAKRNIPAIAIFSGMHQREIDIALDNCIYGNTKLLYISPERLGTELLQQRLQKMKVNLLAIDEAHCISQWGYDFRPAYLQIASIRELLPDIPVLALTASATPLVVEDIQEKLLFKKPNVIQHSFERKNLAYMALKEEDKFGRLKKIIDKVQGSGIVYVRSRKRTQEVSSWLNKNGIKADYYHAGLDNTVRDQKQKNWTNNRCRIMVATNAFGMGIDKPDVHSVVHIDLPESLESYFQEAGRAGRDGNKAYAVMLYETADLEELQRTVDTSFPSIETIQRVYQALANYYRLAIGSGLGRSFEFEISEFSRQYNFRVIQVFNSLRFLEKEGYLTLSEALYLPSRVHFRMNKEELYHFQVAQKSYDSYIKLLLRSYSGLFDGYVKIRESDMARRSGTTKDQITKLLEKLNQMEVISYLPQTRLPLLTFTQARVDSSDLSISPEHYKERKAITLARAQSVIDYATSQTKCRSRILLEYFGEEETYRCGVCDTCIERNKLDVSNLEFENVARQVKGILAQQPLTLHQVVHLIQNSEEKETLKIIQWLLDNKKMAYTEDKKLQWSN